MTGELLLVTIVLIVGFVVLAVLIMRAGRPNRELLGTERDQILQIVQEKLNSGEKFIEGRKDLIKEMLEKIKDSLDENQKKLHSSEKERTVEFSTLKAVLEQHKDATEGLKRTTESLKSILSNNQQRGKYGEEVAENLLKSVGFVKGQTYIANEAQESSSTRPDFTILLPDGTKVNVDAKFPLQSLVKFHEAEGKVDQEVYLKQFSKDVKEKIKQVTTREYINIEEKTVDFVILFIPNEMIFSFIYDRLYDVWNEAMKNKVIMAGPFSFTAILRMIFQSYKNFKYQENMYEIIKLVKQFEVEFTKFTSEFEKLGSRVQSLSDQYSIIATTRTKKLISVMEKIQQEEILPEVTKPVNLLED